MEIFKKKVKKKSDFAGFLNQLNNLNILNSKILKTLMLALTHLGGHLSDDIPPP